MGTWKNMVAGVGRDCLRITIPSMCAVVLWVGMCGPVYGQGTIGETSAALELEGELAGREGAVPGRQGTGQSAPQSAAAPASAPQNQQDLARLERVAGKLFGSMQRGVFDQNDFAAVFVEGLPGDTNFADGLNALYRPVSQQLGNPEALGQGRGTGPGTAVFPVRFSRGSADMTVSVDKQDKIVGWWLTPTAVSSGEQAGQALGAPASADTNIPDINDFNAFQQEIDRMDMEARGEEGQWLGRLEKKSELARAIDERVAAELKFIRALALAQGADKAAKAIDLVLKRRQDRLAKLATRLDDELRAERQQQAAERRERRAARPGAGAPDQTERTRPPRRTREPRPEDQPPQY